MKSSKWWDSDDVWCFWEQCFKEHYHKQLDNYRIASVDEDVIDGIDVFIRIKTYHRELAIQLKANKTKNISRLPVHLAYVNQQGNKCAFDLYFTKKRDNLDTFMFGYPYSGVALIVRAKAMKDVWQKNSKNWKYNHGKMGYDESQYISFQLSKFMGFFKKQDYKLYINLEKVR